MSERPHGRKRNDSGLAGELNRRGEGLGKSGGVGTGARKAAGAIKLGEDLFGSGKGDAFDLNDLLGATRAAGGSSAARAAGAAFDLAELLALLNSGNVRVTNTNNIDIADLIALLQQQAQSGNTTITNNNNISMNELMNALNGSAGYSSNSGYTSQQIQHPQQSSVSHVQQPSQQTQHTMPLSGGGNSHSSNYGGNNNNYNNNNNNKKKGGNSFLFLIILFLLLFFVFGRGGCGGGGTSTDTNTNTNTNTSTNTNPSSGTTSQWNYGTAISNTASYIDGSSDSLNTEVASGARKKYTTLLGNGNDQVTILVYMCGTDLESKYGMGTADLSEMASATHSDKVNIIVETGGTKTWKNNAVTAGTNQYWQVVDGGLLPLETNLGRKNMTDPSTLAEFIRWGTQNFPANRYMLIMWDHGGGSVTGYGYDEIYPNGSMPVNKIQEALEAGGTKFDIIGFDACLMANIECATAVEPYADYLLASEETEPGTGWYYTNWLSKLAANSSMSSLDIGQVVVDDFCTKKQAGSSSSDKVTLSLIDLAEFKNSVPGPFNAFAKKLSSNIRTNDYQTVADARSATREFGAQSKIDQIDLINFANTLNISESKPLVSALQSCIKYNRTANITNSFGISVYFPYRRTQMANSALSVYNAIGFDADYTSVVKSMASLEASGQVVTQSTSNSLFSLLGGSSAGNGTSYESVDLNSLLQSGLLDVLLGGRSAFDESAFDLFDSAYNKAYVPSEDLVITEKNGTRVLSLSDEEWACIQSVKLDVWAQIDDYYIDLGSDNIFEFDGDGDLIVEYDGLWMALNDQIAPYYVLTDEYTDENNYKTAGYIPALLNGEEVRLMVEFTPEYETGRVTGAQAVYETDVESKLMPIEEGDVIEFICDCYSLDGTFDDSYLLNDPITVQTDADGNPVLELTDMRVTADRILFGYEFTDIFGCDRFTPFETY